MARKYEFTIDHEKTGEKILITGELENEDWERLKEFIQYVDDLLKVKLVQSGMPTSLNISWAKDSGARIVTTLPQWDDVIVFLHKIRPILLQSESTNFHKICNILAKNLSNPLLRNIITIQRDLFIGERMQAQFRIISNNNIINSEKILQDWLNAYEFHRNKEKRELIDSLHSMFPFEASKVLFICMLTDKTYAIYNIASLAMTVLGRYKTLEIPLNDNES